MLFLTWKISFVLTVLVQFINCARILIILPTPSLSHHLFFRPIIKELSLRGHEVISVTPDPMKDPTLTNLTEIDTHTAAYEILNVQNAFKAQEKARHIRGFSSKLLQLTENVLDTLQEMIQDPNEHFDLFIVETLSLTALYPFKQRFNCPMIGLASLEARLATLDAIGIPPNPSFYAGFYKIGGHNLSFWQRLDNFWDMMDFRFFYYFDLLPKYNKLAQKYFGSDVTDLSTLEKSMDLLLTNTNPVFHVPRPLVPNAIEIGGLHKREKQPLPQDLQELLDSSKKGIIYFSLGSNVKSSSLPNSTLDNILKVFEKLPFNVLWKWENTTLPNKPKNVFIKQWLPQQDVLDHPNVKGFVTQGGLQSIEEAISSKVPMVGIPFGGDQHFNVDRIVALGIGRQLLFEELSIENLFEAIIDVATNPSYKNQIAKRASQIWDQEMKPLDRAIWWIEYVIRHRGAQHLRCPAADLSWFKYLLLDVIGFILICLIISIVFLIVIIKASLRFVIKKQLKDKLE